MVRFGPLADAPRDCHSEDLSTNEFWLSQLPGGLPSKFDYRIVRSIAAAKTLILTLPHCDRGQAAVGLFHHRRLIGHDPVYSGIMVAWDHGHQELVDAFGSSKQFLSALREVTPQTLSSTSGRMDLWRGVVLDKMHALVRGVGLSWSESRDVACWFALRDYVPALQPSLVPVVLRASLDRSAIIVQHNARAEREVIVDPDQTLLVDSKLGLDGVNAALGCQTPLCNFDPDGAVFDRLIEGWRMAARRFQRRKGQIERQQHLAHKVDADEA